MSPGKMRTAFKRRFNFHVQVEIKLLFIYFNTIFAVRQNFAAGFGARCFFWMTALSDGTVAVSGGQANQYKLKRFLLETGRELSSVDMNNVYRITEMKLGLHSTIALDDL